MKCFVMSTKLQSILFSRLSWEYNLHRVVSFSNHFIRLMLCVICYVFCLLSRGSVNSRSKNVESMSCAINIKRNTFNSLTLNRKLHVKEQPVYWLAHSKSLAACLCFNNLQHIDQKHLYELIKCFVHRSFKVVFFLSSFRFNQLKFWSLSEEIIKKASCFKQFQAVLTLLWSKCKNLANE